MGFYIVEAQLTSQAKYRRCSLGPREISWSCLVAAIRSSRALDGISSVGEIGNSSKPLISKDAASSPLDER